MNNFLPNDYKVPQGAGNYMKFQDGENNFRVLSSAVVGYEYWNRDNKPVRLKEMPQQAPIDLRDEKDGSPGKIKHFWAFMVWNYEAKAVQVLELTQKSVMGAIKALVDNSKWGDPKRYDITVTKTGDGLDTEYSVMPNPHAEFSEEVKSNLLSKAYNLQNLFEGKDVFATE